MKYEKESKTSIKEVFERMKENPPEKWREYDISLGVEKGSSFDSSSILLYNAIAQEYNKLTNEEDRRKFIEVLEKLLCKGKKE